MFGEGQVKRLSQPGDGGLLCREESARERNRKPHDPDALRLLALGRVAASVSHDFKNLLMGLIGACRRAEQLTSRGESAGALLEEMRRTAESGVELTKRLLDCSRPAGARRERIDLGLLILDLTVLLRSILGDTTRLELDLQTASPILADRGQLQQILMNLVANARDAMTSGGVLSISLTEQDSEVVLTVADTGTGMNEETLQQAFNPYYTTKGDDGTGLGLDTVRQITEELGGSVRLSSQPDEGTTISLRFPAARERSKRNSPTKIPSGDGQPVLVIDDEHLIRLTIRHILEEGGYEVLEAGTVKRARSLWETYEDIQVVVSDIRLPGGDGPSFVKTLGPVPTVFMSARPRELLLQEGRVPENVLCLEKPFDPEVLLLSVHTALKQARVENG